MYCTVADPALDHVRDPGLAQDLASNPDPALYLDTNPERLEFIFALGPGRKF